MRTSISQCLYLVINLSICLSVLRFVYLSSYLHDAFINWWSQHHRSLHRLSQRGRSRACVCVCVCVCVIWGFDRLTERESGLITHTKHAQPHTRTPERTHAHPHARTHARAHTHITENLLVRQKSPGHTHRQTRMYVRTHARRYTHIQREADTDTHLTPHCPVSVFETEKHHRCRIGGVLATDLRHHIERRLSRGCIHTIYICIYMYMYIWLYIYIYTYCT
jgi:hypothetical protein